MNLCLLTGYLPLPLKETVKKNTKAYLQNSAFVFQEKYIEGLSCYYNNIQIINAPFVGYYPLKYRTCSVPDCDYTYQSNNCSINVRSIPFSTLPIAYSISRRTRIYKELERWIAGKEKEQNVIIIYSTHLPFMEASVELRKKVKDLRILIIIPDFPQFMNNSSAILSRIHQHINDRLYSKGYERLYAQMDGFIFITEHMKNFIHDFNKPYIVIEGMASQFGRDAISYVKEKYIFYGGTLAEKFGVGALLDAFLRIKHSEYKLFLCGNGDTVERIKQLEKKENICYLGEISNEKVLELQKKATLLINPRQNVGEYTKYSFPSKVMEYFVSGTPTLMYKLDGIPEEYYNYCFSLDDNSTNVLAEKIDQILDMSDNELQKIGTSAKEFVLREKSPKAQCKKIIDFLTNCIFSVI